MYRIKSIARRASALGTAVAVLAAAVVPSAAVFADSLNPLTERSLLLTSSAPGFQDTDGSGNSVSAPNAVGENYAPAGSGPNGKKSGQTFSFRVSTDSTSRPIKAFTLQYCTEAAGLCQGPGNNTGDARDDLPSARETNAAAHPNGRSDLDVVYDSAVAGTDFGVYMDLNDDGDFLDAGEDVSTDQGVGLHDWVMATSNVEDTAHTGDLTGKDNFITLTNVEGITPTNGMKIQIVFNATEDDYITNPGSDAFFVKMNTYDSDNTAHHIPTIPATTNTYIIDGGVTVANVMTDSIHITTKVLETMAFSVGTQNPDTQNVPHGICDAIDVVDNNRLNLGNPNAEYSLETDTAYDVYSYWRLSSNSSGGATVYYSGNTLANTVGDEISEMGAEDYSHPGTEQFGLALVDAGDDVLDGGSFPAEHVTPNIAPLNIGTEYDEGEGTISDVTTTNNAKFAFYKSSLTTPEVIAENSDDVISCATSKIRYVANIAADTPAGVYTTKINYLAAPQY